MTPVEKLAQGYWDAFREGFMRVGGKDYPKWRGSRDPIKDETLRCMRHAAESLRVPDPSVVQAGIDAYFGSCRGTMTEEQAVAVYEGFFEAMFPDAPVKRALLRTKTDTRFAKKVAT